MTPKDILLQSSIRSGTPSDAVFISEEAFVHSSFSSGEGVKIFGKDNHNIDYGIDIPINLIGKSAKNAFIYICHSAEDRDSGYVYLNGTQIYVTPNVTGRNIYEVPLSLVNDSINTISVTYTKDNTVSKNDDAMYIFGIKYSVESI